jgi:hypothetical protein
MQNGWTHGDTDLGVDGSGDFVLDTLLPPEIVAQLPGGSGHLDLRSLIKSLIRSAP